MRRILLLLVLAPLLTLLFRGDRLRRWMETHTTVLRNATLLVALGLIAAVAACGVSAVVQNRSVLDDEASVLSVAVAYFHGQQIYPAADAPEVYGLIYGPSTYLAYLPPLAAGAVELSAFKAWSLAALLASFLLLFFTLKPFAGRRNALLGCGFFAVLVCLNLAHELAMKGDSWILFFSALSFWSVVHLRRWIAMAALAACGAILVNLKATMFAPALLPCLYLWLREGDRERGRAVLAALLILPLSLAFFDLPRVSLAPYLELLRAGAHHGYSMALFRFNLMFLMLVALLPLAFAWLAGAVSPQALAIWFRSRRSFLAALLLCTVVAAITGAKHGAGVWHCMAIAVPLTLLVAELLPLAFPAGSSALDHHQVRLALLLAVAINLVFVAYQGLVRDVTWRRAAMNLDGPEQELKQIMRDHPGTTLQMGYTDEDHFEVTFVRPILLLHGNPLVIDTDAFDDAEAAGLAPFSGARDAFKTCNIGIYILPHGGEPFSIESLYHEIFQTGPRDMFPADFRQAFLASYTKSSQNLHYFDLWTCSRPSAAHGPDRVR